MPQRGIFDVMCIGGPCMGGLLVLLASLELTVKTRKNTLMIPLVASLCAVLSLAIVYFLYSNDVIGLIGFIALLISILTYIPLAIRLKREQKLIQEHKKQQAASPDNSQNQQTNA